MPNPLPHCLLVTTALGALAGSANANYRRAGVVPAVEPSDAIAFGHGTQLRVDRADLDLTTDKGDLRGSLRIVLSTWDTDYESRFLEIAVPPGTEIRTLAVTIDGNRFDSEVVGSTLGARQDYLDTVDRIKDPALLEHITSTDQQTWLRLHVFPVTPDHPATIELALSLPHTTTIAIDPRTYRIANARISIDDVVSQTSKLESRLEAAVPPSTLVAAQNTTPFVDATHSIYAGPRESEQDTLDGIPNGGHTVAWRHPLRVTRRR